MTLRQAHEHLERMQAQLYQQEKLASLGLLAAGVAHEINNPIGFLSSNLKHLESHLDALTTYLKRAELCAQAAGGGEELAALRQELEIEYVLSDVPGLLADAREGAARVARIVRDLKMFSHSGGGEAVDADLHQILESTLTILATELKCRAEVVRQYGGLPLVRCHLSQIQQVFLNLIVNAIQAMPERGTITLRTGGTSQEAWVEVSDTGCGIPAKHLPRIFDPFFTTKPVGQGTGLGLAISYGIVERHGGRIEVTSQEGGGTTFRVVLPLNGSIVQADPR
jgi:signal transduction histidine kinase